MIGASSHHTDSREGSEEECSKNLCGGTVAATLGNCEHFWCSWNSYFQPLLCGCNEGIGRDWTSLLSSVHNHRAKIKMRRMYFAQGIILPASVLPITLFFLILVLVVVNLLEGKLDHL